MSRSRSLVEVPRLFATAFLVLAAVARSGATAATAAPTHAAPQGAADAPPLTGFHWETFGLSGRYVSTLCRSGTTVYAATDQGVFRRDVEPSRDSGWAPVPGTFSIPSGRWIAALARDPFTTGTLYAGIGWPWFPVGGVEQAAPPPDVRCWKSTDGGGSWSPCAEGMTAPDVFALPPIAGAPGQILLGGGQRIFKTLDGGRSWRFMANVGSTIWCATTHPTSTTIVLVGTMGSLDGTPAFMRSTDAGATWQGFNGFNYMAYGLFGFGFSIVMDPRDEHISYGGASRCVYKRIVRGTSDQKWLYDSGLGHVFALLVHPDDSQLVFAAGQCADPPTERLGFSFSTDAAATWTTVPPPSGSPRPWCLAVDPVNPHAVLAGTLGGGVYRLTWDGPAQYALYAEPDAGGAVHKSLDCTYFDPGTAVTLTAIGGPHSAFVEWYGDVGATTATATSAQNPLVLTMDRTRVVRARFGLQKYAVTATAGASGTVVRTPQQARYDWGSVVTLTARPYFSYRFTQWTGDVPPGRSRENPLILTVDTTRTLTGQFGLDGSGWWMLR